MSRKARKKLTWIKLKSAWWVEDNVAGCSLAAQGLWLRLMFIMNQSERHGYLEEAGKPIPMERLSRRIGENISVIKSLMEELKNAGVPSLFENKSCAVWYSRRMVSEEQKRRKSRRMGKKGGNPALMGGDKGIDNPLNARARQNIRTSELENIRTRELPKAPLSSNVVIDPMELNAHLAKVEELIAQGQTTHATATWTRFIKTARVRGKATFDDVQTAIAQGGPPWIALGRWVEEDRQTIRQMAARVDKASLKKAFEAEIAKRREQEHEKDKLRAQTEAKLKGLRTRYAALSERFKDLSPEERGLIDEKAMDGIKNPSILHRGSAGWLLSVGQKWCELVEAAKTEGK